MPDTSSSNNSKIDGLLKHKPVERRSFLKAVAAAAGAMTVLPTKKTDAFSGIFPNKKNKKAAAFTWEKFFQK